MELRIVDAKNADFAALAKKLDAYYFELVGDVHLRYAEFNRPENFACLAVVYENDIPVACGAWKVVDETSAELKRIYVLPEHRRKGAAKLIIRAMEENAASTGRTHMILETARTMEDSASLYLSLGYQERAYYGSLAGEDNCLCFEKDL